MSPEPIDLSVWSRRGLPPEFTEAATTPLRRLLATVRPAIGSRPDLTVAAAS